MAWCMRPAAIVRMAEIVADGVDVRVVAAVDGTVAAAGAVDGLAAVVVVEGIAAGAEGRAGEGTR